MEAVTGLVDGQTVEIEVEGKRCPVRFLNPELGLINTDDPIRLHVSAYGPRSRALTARLGAGWLYFASDVPGALEHLGHMRRAWESAGRWRSSGT